MRPLRGFRKKTSNCKIIRRKGRFYVIKRTGGTGV